MRRYGWFWECPNGENCHYRHALPPGFVLKSQKKALEDAEKANAISLEEFLEVEVRLPSMSASLGDLDITFLKRHKLGSNLTPVTPESFAKWKQTRMDKKLAEEEALKKAKDEKPQDDKEKEENPVRNTDMPSEPHLDSNQATAISLPRSAITTSAHDAGGISFHSASCVRSTSNLNGLEQNRLTSTTLPS